jgi:peptidoglycan/LPS O-acetylase OafA/YrhL
MLASKLCKPYIAGEPEIFSLDWFLFWARRKRLWTAGISIGLVLLSMKNWLVCGAISTVLGFFAFAFLVFSLSSPKGQKMRWALRWLCFLALWLIVVTIGKPPPFE